MVSNAFRVGDRIVTPSGKTGAILPPEWLMPCHHLVQFDDGSKRWMLRELLSAAPGEVLPHKRRKKTA
jgi:hypothetical protein